MSHEQFCTDIRTRLSNILSSNLFISKQNSNQLEETPKIFISIRRFDNSSINVYVSADVRVFQLKKAIQQQNFANEKLNWKSIWKKYTLTTSDHRDLINNNRKIKSYGITNNTELSFVRQRRFK